MYPSAIWTQHSAPGGAVYLTTPNPEPEEARSVAGSLSLIKEAVVERSSDCLAARRERDQRGVRAYIEPFSRGFCYEVSEEWAARFGGGCPGSFFPHRGQGLLTGRNAAAISREAP